MKLGLEKWACPIQLRGHDNDVVRGLSATLPLMAMSGQNRYLGIGTGLFDNRWLLAIVERRPRRFSAMPCALLVSLCIGLLSSVVALAQSETQQVAAVIGPNGEIYGNANAKRLVEEARKFDPMFCLEDQRDRDKAVLLYQQAIDAQPGAKINAMLANRVAQLYAFYADRKKNVTPVRSNARKWWKRCLESTNPRQLLWAQAQMGLICTAADSKSAIAACDNILKIDANQIELDNWKSWPEGDQSKTLRDRKKDELRKQIVKIQSLAKEKRSRIEEQIKLAEQRKADEAGPPQQQPKTAKWNYKQSLLLAAWLTLGALFVGSRIVKRRRRVKL